jgi:hypothetical protein
MRKPLAIGAATLAVTLSLGLAACGSSDDDSGNDDALSNSELVSKADAICTDYNQQLVDITDNSKLTNDSSKTEVAAFISDEIVPLYKKQIDELRGLQPNDEDAEAYNEIVDTLSSELKTVEDDPKASVTMEDPFAGASKKADEFGLKECGSN